MAEKINKLIFSIEFTEKGAIRKINGVEKSVKKFNTELQRATASNKEFNNTLSGREGMVGNAGLAGATLTELGRTISDSNYGIRGMANNLSQLSTLFITLVSKVDDNVTGIRRVGRAFQMLGKQIMGPLGIILVFQIIIQQIEKADLKARELGGTLDDFAKQFAKDSTLITNLRQAANTISRLSEDSLSYQIALQTLIKEGYDPTIGKVEEFIKVKERLLGIDREEAKQSKENIENITLQLLTAEEELKKLDEKTGIGRTLQAGGAMVKGIFQGDLSLVGRRNPVATLRQQLENRISVLQTQLSIANSVVEDIGEEGDEIIMNSPYLTLITGEDTKKESDVAKIIKKTTDAINKLTAQSDKELLEVARDRALKEIQLAKGTEEEKAKARMLILKQFQLEVNALFDELAEEEKDRVSDVMEDAYDTYERLVDNLQKSNEDATKKMQDTILFNLRNQIKELNTMKQTMGQLFSSMTTVLTSINDIQQEFHQANIDRINREKDLVLQNDSLTQQEKDRRLKEIESREIAAEKRKIKAERDMFTLQQTLGIAKALFDLKMFKQRALLDAQLLTMSAQKAQVDIGVEAAKDTSSSIGTLPRFIKDLGAIAGPIAYGASIVGMIAAIVKARRAAKNAIANLVPSSNIGVGGESSPVAAPAFNVVGATQTSQLAQTIAGADDKPVKAFVVASDVTTAQELERSTIEGASLG
jgi:hypothetical protein